jgi:Fe-S cluster assembly ATP-binding protein
MHLIQIKNLHAGVEGVSILKGLNLTLGKGEVHAIMGPNGAGKSTLANVLAGHPAYEVTAGEIWFKGESLLDKEPEERAALGLFMSFQYPVEIPGVTNRQFLFAALNSQRKASGKPPLSKEEFELLLEQKMALMEMRAEFKDRAVNEGFSGGEKKKNEILQMALFEPALAILDETDSGLDIDAIRSVASSFKQLKKKEQSFLLITHYQRLLDSIRPDFVHVMADGKIARTGGPELALELEARGYA